MDLVLRNGLVNHANSGFSRTDIRIRRNSIVEVGQLSSTQADQVWDVSDRLVVPGLINSHVHSNEHWLRGRFENLPLEAWLPYAYPAVESPVQDPEEIYVRTALTACEMVRAGVSTVVDCVYELGGSTSEGLDAICRAYRDVGMRALICLSLADVAPGQVPTARRPSSEVRSHHDVGELDTYLELAAQYSQPDVGITIGLAPVGIHRCTDDLLWAIGSSGLELHVHLAESKAQVNAARASGFNLVERAERLGVLGPRTHLSHAVWLDDADIERVAQTGATIVHNPMSNLKLGNGIAPVPAFLAAGISVALGTDGVCTGDSLSMFEVIKFASLLHKGFGPPETWIRSAEFWHAATEGGARAAGRAGKIGRIAPGADADLLLLDLGHPSFIPLNDPLLHLTLSTPVAAVREVIVNGRPVLSQGKVHGVNEATLRSDGARLATAFHERMKPYDVLADQEQARIRQRLSDSW